ncbi:MAG: hypothetical protein ACE5I2_14715 [Anaerolineae bacterium]
MKKISLGICVITLVVSLLLAPSITRAQQAGSEEEDAVFYVGSALLSLIYFPIRLTTCVATQAVTAVAYTATHGVEGNFDGGTNGKQIGEVARGACMTPWTISFDEVKEDYQ